MELTKLQSIKLPDRQICAEDELYFRRKSIDQFETKPVGNAEFNSNHNVEIKSINTVEFNFVYYDELQRKLVFKKYARSKFNTYFKIDITFLASAIRSYSISGVPKLFQTLIGWIVWFANMFESR